MTDADAGDPVDPEASPIQKTPQPKEEESGPVQEQPLSLLDLNRHLQSLIESQILQMELAQTRNLRLQTEILDHLSGWADDVETEASETSVVSVLNVGKGVTYPRRCPPFFIDKNREVPGDNEDVARYGDQGWTKVDVLYDGLAWKATEDRTLLKAIKRQALIQGIQSDKLSKEDEDRLDIDWNKVAKEIPSRTAKQCEIRWDTKLRPSINQRPFSATELDSLLSIAERHNHRDWIKIAQELGTGRTAWQTFRAFKTQVKPNHKGGKWTPEEDTELLQAIAKVGTKSWVAVASEMSGRTGAQCMFRYIHVLKPGRVKGRWTKEEDEQLLRGFALHGRGNWSKVASFVPTRTDAQVRERYENVLNPDLRKGKFSQEEFELLESSIEKHGEGKWSLVAKDVPNRTDDQCKIAWKQLQRRKNSLATSTSDALGIEEADKITQSKKRGRSTQPKKRKKRKTS